MIIQCEGIKKDGNRCTRKIKSGQYCYQHGPDSNAEPNAEPKSKAERKPKPKAEPKPEHVKYNYVLPQSDYKILGIPPGASSKEIRSAYLKLSLKWHPDKCNLPEAKEKFQQIKDAYEKLSIKQI